MSITNFQRDICRVISANRIETGESYVAGGVALNTLIDASRLSSDIDLFHDVQEAVITSWHADSELLEKSGYVVTARRHLPTFIEAVISRGPDNMIMQWAQDSAYRFFPLQTHEDFGLTLHPFDLATNKVLALVGRLEVRDWIDVISCDTSIQPLGYLIWAAAGKDIGLSPPFILDEAARSSRYSQIEVETLSFADTAPSAAHLSQQWRVILAEARIIVDLLPANEVGRCVLDLKCGLFRASSEDLPSQLKSGFIRFHSGSIRGAYPIPI